MVHTLVFEPRFMNLQFTSEICFCSHESRAEFFFNSPGKSAPSSSMESLSTVRGVAFAKNLYDIFHPGFIRTLCCLSTGNFATQIFVNIARPFLGDFAGRIEVHGNVKERWIPRLLRRIPADQLPPQYGGDASKFKMVEYYGWYLRLWWTKLVPKPL